MAKFKYLMCPPDYFDISYSINPWMDTAQTAGANKKEQWDYLYNKFVELGVEVSLLTPQKDLPDMVYTDVGILYENTFIPSNFRFPERQGEKKFNIEWFARNGYKVVEIPEEYYFEGHGDTLWAGENLFFGYGFRSSIEAQHQVTDILKGMDSGINVIPVELTDPRFYHLDTCFCPLNEKQALCYLPAISEMGQALLREHIELISVPEEEALHFACNSVKVGDQILIPADTPKTCAMLEKMGYKTHPIPMTEFIKGGGACKCLSMPLTL